MTANGTLEVQWGEQRVPGRAASADALLTGLWVRDRAALVRLSALLLSDPAGAEDVVQEAYVRACAAGRSLRDESSASAYLRRTVVNLARSEGRHRTVVRRHAERAGREPAADVPSAEAAALDRVRNARVVVALNTLGRRQREAIVLRYFGGLTESAAAAAMGVSIGAVKSYCSRGLAALGPMLEDLR